MASAAGKAASPNQVNQIGESEKVRATTESKDSSLSIDSTDSLTQELLSARGLAERLGTDASTLKRNRVKGNEHLASWSRKRDPAGQAWQYVEVEQKYKPLEL